MTALRWTTLVRSRYAPHALGAALLIGAVVIVTQLQRLQQAEANLAAVVLAFTMFPDAVAPGNYGAVFFSLTDGQQMGIQISAQNAAAVLAFPLILASTAIVWARPGLARQALTALAAGAGALVVENQARILLTALTADNSPPRYRYEIGATVFGSMVTVLCMAASILLFVLVLLKMPRRNRETA